jgi:NAD(P)-dependent dehydrogenase (short-subunit alcohol dehydrogenase family)
MGRVDEKVALISGGARGMGAAHARMLVAEGAKVVIGDILDDEGKALADELGSGAGGPARYVHLDVTQADQWDTAVATAVGEFGKLNVLVNNAGIVALGQIGKFDMVKWQKVIEGSRRRVDHQRLVDRGAARRSDGAPVRGIEVGGARSGQVGGNRARQAQDSGQLVASRLHPHPHDEALPGRHGDRTTRPPR